jgi:hypothetical protein
MNKHVLLPLVVFAASGCDFPFGACETISLPGLVVAVVDSIDRTPATGDEIVVIAIDGSDGDTIRYSTSIPDPLGLGRVPLVYENAGIYRVQVSVTGYRPWVRTGVRVSRSRCHVETVNLVARMQR